MKIKQIKKPLYRITVGPRELNALRAIVAWRAVQPDYAVNSPSDTPFYARLADVFGEAVNGT